MTERKKRILICILERKIAALEECELYCTSEALYERLEALEQIETTDNEETK